VVPLSASSSLATKSRFTFTRDRIENDRGVQRKHDGPQAPMGSEVLPGIPSEGFGLKMRKKEHRGKGAKKIEERFGLNHREFWLEVCRGRNREQEVV